MSARAEAARRLAPLPCGHRDPIADHVVIPEPDCPRPCQAWDIEKLLSIAAEAGRCPCGVQR